MFSTYLFRKVKINKPLGTNGPPDKNDTDKTQDIRMPDSMFLVY